jgi:hypothetical protein
VHFFVGWSALLKAVAPIFYGAIGGSAAILGLSRWLGNVWLGRLLEKEKAKYAEETEKLKAEFAKELEHYRAQLDRSTFVTRAHFETELEAYKQVFEGLGEVRLAIAGTRPMMGLGGTKEERTKILEERLDDLVKAHNKTARVTEHLSPFYPQDIHLKVGECLTAARGEILDIQTGGDSTFSSAWYEKGQKRLDVFFSAYNSVTEAIRHRISTLAIIPR